MKKSLAVLSMAAVVLTATPAIVSANGGNQSKGLAIGRFFGDLFRHFEHKVPSTSFVISGSVVSTSTNSLVVSVLTSANIQTITGGQSTVMTDSNTKITGPKNVSETLANLAAGDRIEITGNVNGSTLTATNIHDAGSAPVAPITTSGKVTAVSATSITLSNAIAGTSQVFTIDSNTKVTIDGTAKTVADIQAGDAGTIRSKNVSAVFTAQMINLFR